MRGKIVSLKSREGVFVDGSNKKKRVEITISLSVYELEYEKILQTFDTQSEIELLVWFP